MLASQVLCGSYSDAEAAAGHIRRHLDSAEDSPAAAATWGRLVTAICSCGHEATVTRARGVLFATGCVKPLFAVATTASQPDDAVALALVATAQLLCELQASSLSALLEVLCGPDTSESVFLRALARMQSQRLSSAPVMTALLRLLTRLSLCARHDAAIFTDCIVAAANAHPHDRVVSEWAMACWVNAPEVSAGLLHSAASIVENHASTSVAVVVHALHVVAGGVTRTIEGEHLSLLLRLLDGVMPVAARLVDRACVARAAMAATDAVMGSQSHLVGLADYCDLVFTVLSLYSKSPSGAEVIPSAVRALARLDDAVAWQGFSQQLLADGVHPVVVIEALTTGDQASKTSLRAETLLMCSGFVAAAVMARTGSVDVCRASLTYFRRCREQYTGARADSDQAHDAIIVATCAVILRHMDNGSMVATALVVLRELVTPRTKVRLR